MINSNCTVLSTKGLESVTHLTVPTYFSAGVALRDSICAAESCTCSSDNECFRPSTKCECPCTSPLEFEYCQSHFPNSSLGEF